MILPLQCNLSDTIPSDFLFCACCFFERLKYFVALVDATEFVHHFSRRFFSWVEEWITGFHIKEEI